MLESADFNAVIFDMDGLVLDTESTYHSAWQQAASAMGYELSDVFCRSLSGLNGADITRLLIELCGPDFDLTLFNRTAAHIWRDTVGKQGIKIKYGFSELLDFIIRQQIPYCLATNSRADNARECLMLGGIADAFPMIISRDDVQSGKPEPDIFLKAAESLQVPISRCLILEDSHAGILAASRAGAKSVFIPSCLPVDPLTVELCDWMLSDLAQVLSCLKESKSFRLMLSSPIAETDQV